MTKRTWRRSITQPQGTVITAEMAANMNTITTEFSKETPRVWKCGAAWRFVAVCAKNMMEVVSRMSQKAAVFRAWDVVHWASVSFVSPRLPSTGSGGGSPSGSRP